MRIISFTTGAIAAAMLAAAPAQAQVTRVKANPDALILQAADVKAGSDIIFLSGQLAAPIDPALPMGQVTSIEQMGDTKTQTISALNKIKAILHARGYAMSDVVKMTLFLVKDPRLGQMDFAGANAGFRTFFGTAENPETVARSTVEVAALVGPHYLIEIEATAAKAATPAAR